MSYVTTKLSGIIRSRLSFGRVIARGNLTTYSRVFAVESNKNFISDIRSQSYFTKAVNLKTSTPIVKILSKLKSNKISLQFDNFTTIRPQLFKNYKITVEDGFMILKSCSQLVNRSTEDRIKLVDECWNELLPILETPTKDYLILLLQAYRRAGLKSLNDYQLFFEKYNCPLDADLYAELLYIACQNGDTMETAETLLKDIEHQKIKPNERIFSALILGYSKQGIDAVEKVLETMKSKGLVPSSDTNTELIKAYILNGNNNRAIEILHQSNDYNSDQLFDIIRSAANASDETIVKEAISLLPETIQNAKQIATNLQNICVEMVHLNCNRSTTLDPYQLIIQHLPVPVFEFENTNEYGAFLIKEMIVANEKMSNILRFCDNLIDSQRNLYAIHICCVYSLTFNLPSSRDFLEALAAREQLRPHYFWPLFARASNQSDVIDIIKFGTKFNVIFDTNTLINWVLPKANTLINSQKTVKALTDAGVRMLHLKTAIITYLLNYNRPKEALDIASLSASPFDPIFIKPALVKFVKCRSYKPNAHTISILIKKLQNRCTDKTFDLAGQIALSICNKQDQRVNFTLTNELLTDYNRFEVNISWNSANAILEELSKNRNIKEKLGPIVQSLINNELFADVQTDPKLAAKSVSDIETLQQQLSEFKANDLPVHGILYRLFLQYVHDERYDEALKIKDECEKVGVIETQALLSTTLKLWTAIKHHDNALKTLKTLQNKYPHFKIDAYKIIDLATLLISNERLDDAKTLINDLDPIKAKNTSYLSNNLWRLLNTASECNNKCDDVDSMAGYFLKKLIDKGYCTHSNALLGTVIKEYLNKKKIHEAVATFEHYANEFQCTPQCVSLMTILIELSNEENITEYNVTREQAIEYLQRIIDLTKEIHGMINANVNVILSFACAGKEQQLRKILLDPNVKFNADVLLKSLSYLKDRMKIHAVVTMARCARGLHHTSLNEESLLDLLLSDFVRTNDYASAVQLFEEIQQWDDKPISKKFAKTLSELLKKNNQPIPIQLKAVSN